MDFETSLFNGCLLQYAWMGIKCDLLQEAESWRPGAFVPQNLLVAPSVF